MSDEKADDGILGKAKRLADQVGDYARSDEAREKLDAVKKNAIKAGGMASTGAKRLAEGTKQAADQAKVKADEFSKSEKGEALKAKAKEGWDEIRGGRFRGLRLCGVPGRRGAGDLALLPTRALPALEAPRPGPQQDVVVGGGGVGPPRRLGRARWRKG